MLLAARPVPLRTSHSGRIMPPGVLNYGAFISSLIHAPGRYRKVGRAAPCLRHNYLLNESPARQTPSDWPVPDERWGKPTDRTKSRATGPALRRIAKTGALPKRQAVTIGKERRMLKEPAVPTCSTLTDDQLAERDSNKTPRGRAAPARRESGPNVTIGGGPPGEKRKAEPPQVTRILVLTLARITVLLPARAIVLLPPVRIIVPLARIIFLPARTIIPLTRMMEMRKEVRPPPSRMQSFPS